MPSWNIHTAHVEKLLRGESAAALGVGDVNAFLFGNFVPDVYVGYMVEDISKKIEYRDTHLARPDFIPKPNASLFYRRYVRGRAEVSDVVLGAWCHLLCDHYYNLRTNEFIECVGVEPGERTRIRKQGDFDLFGRTLSIASVPEATARLVAQCAAFPQYAIEEPDARASVEVAARIVEHNREAHVEGVPAYSLLTPAFFSATFAEVDEVLRSALRAFVTGEDASVWGCDEAMDEAVPTKEDAESLPAVGAPGGSAGA